MSVMTHRLLAYWPDGSVAASGGRYPSEATARAALAEERRDFPGWRWRVEPLAPPQPAGADLPEALPVQVWVYTDDGARLAVGAVRVLGSVAGDDGGAVYVTRRDALIFDVWASGPAGGGGDRAPSCVGWASAVAEGLNLIHALTRHATNAAIATARAGAGAGDQE